MIILFIEYVHVHVYSAEKYNGIEQGNKKDQTEGAGEKLLDESLLNLTGTAAVLCSCTIYFSIIYFLFFLKCYKYFFIIIWKIAFGPNHKVTQYIKENHEQLELVLESL